MNLPVLRIRILFTTDPDPGIFPQSGSRPKTHFYKGNKKNLGEIFVVKKKSRYLFYKTGNGNFYLVLFLKISANHEKFAEKVDFHLQDPDPEYGSGQYLYIILIDQLYFS